MVPTSKDIIKHELIGLQVEVLSDSNVCNEGVKGQILDETMYTLMVKTNGVKSIAKKNAVFKFKLNSEAVKVKGAALISRPEDRVKKSKKREW